METIKTMSSEPTPPFLLGTDTSAVHLRVRRQTAPTHLTLRTSAKEGDESHWTSRLPLPPLIDVLIVHKKLAEEKKVRVISYDLPRSRVIYPILPKARTPTLSPHLLPPSPPPHF